MADFRNWSWEEEKRSICDLKTLRERFSDVHELVVSPDGERIAAPVITAPETFGICVNGELWEGEYEKAWHLKFAPDGRLTALVRVDDEWTVATDGELWDELWEFAWDTHFSPDGSAIVVQVKDNMEYTVAVNGQTWETRFHSSRGITVNHDGSKVAALVQVEPLAEGDIFGFMEGTWSVAVNGLAWDRKFINAYAPVFSPDGAHVAVEIRTDICDYTLAEDGVPWSQIIRLRLGAHLPTRRGCVPGAGAHRRRLDRGRKRQPDLEQPFHAAVEPEVEPKREASGRGRCDQLRLLDGGG